MITYKGMRTMSVADTCDLLVGTPNDAKLRFESDFAPVFILQVSEHAHSAVTGVIYGIRERVTDEFSVTVYHGAELDKNGLNWDVNVKTDLSYWSPTDMVAVKLIKKIVVPFDNTLPARAYLDKVDIVRRYLSQQGVNDTEWLLVNVPPEHSKNGVSDQDDNEDM
jgi:hypothetical protein